MMMSEREYLAQRLQLTMAWIAMCFIDGDVKARPMREEIDQLDRRWAATKGRKQ